MFLTLFWIGLPLIVLLLWAAFVRGNAHFTTRWLRFAFSVPGWLVLVVGVAAICYREEVLSGYEFRAWVQSIDVLVADRKNLAIGAAITVVVGSLALLVVGLRARVAADGRGIPRARSWRWSILLSGPVLLAALFCGGVELYERSLQRELAVLAVEGQGKLSAVDARWPPLPDEQNAAVLYRRADALLEPGDPLSDNESIRGFIHRLDWHGRDVKPLSPQEEQAASLIVEAGKMPLCRFHTVVSNGEESSLDTYAWTRICALLLRRAATSDDEARFHECIRALRQFNAHWMREPTPPTRYFDNLGGELNFLWLIADLAAKAPDRVATLDRALFQSDDAATILGPWPDEAELLDGENGLAISRLLQPDMAADELNQPWQFGGVKQKLEFGVPTTRLQRSADRLDRISKTSHALSLYRVQIERFRNAIAAAKSTGKPDWPELKIDLFSKDESTEMATQYEYILGNMLGIALVRFQSLAARRLGNAALAAAAFGHGHDRLPQTLDELVPEFLDAVPLDPQTGRPIGLETIPDGIILHVSDGPNAVNNGLAVLQDPSTTWDVAGLTAIRVRRPKP